MRNKLKTFFKLYAVAGALAFSGHVSAQAYLECGTSACTSNVQPWSASVTGVNDLSVKGNLYDVNFLAPTTSPFVFSSSVAASGQKLTGVDAGNAISAFYGGLLPPYDGYPIAGDPGPAFITAFAPAGASSAQYFGATTLWDVAETSVGGGAEPTTVFGNNGFNAAGDSIVANNGNEIYYTSWKPISAPEIDPKSAWSGFALLIGGLAVLRGRRRSLA